MIHVMATSANISKNYDERKSQYLEGVASIKTHYKVSPYIIECHGKTDYLSEHLVGSNDLSINNGANELMNIGNFLAQFSDKFHHDDHIIKTTLRYQVTSSCLMDVINQSDHEIYCKRSTDMYGARDPGVHTFLISMKYRCWQDFLLNHFNHQVVINHPIEHQVAAYAQLKDTLYLDRLGMLARPRGLTQTYSV
jgi:hypothetical protein